ncbi:HD-domain/PDEase-like protein [Backusella circina FSU 941]|nr:HD-domain/PDEase-like protein [Backusella circina FSU 941]
MFSLQYNKETLSIDDLETIEENYNYWINKAYNTNGDNEINVLDFNRFELFGYLLFIFSRFDVYDTLNATPSQLLDFLIDVEGSYNDTPYHSFYHAADVVTVLYYILCDLHAKQFLSSFEIASLLIAAITHDAGHDGYNNDYHVKLQTELAIRYKNKSVLESLSVDIVIKLTKKHGLFTKEQERTYIRHLILATDMANHYDLLERASDLEDTMCAYHHFWQEEEEDLMSDISETLISPLGFTPISSIFNRNNGVTFDNASPQYLLDPSQRLVLSSLLLHAADISNAVRSWTISKQWSDLIIQEFFRQGDAEKMAGLTVSPGMDRNLDTQASISLKFIDFIVKPYFETIAGLLPTASVFLSNLEENAAEWQRLKNSPLAISISNTSSWFRHRQNRMMSLAAGTVTLQQKQQQEHVNNNRKLGMTSTKPVTIRNSHHHHDV